MGNSKLAEKYSKLHFADWDEDGLEDILMGHTRGEIVLYLNNGKKGEPAFDEPVVIKPEKGAFPMRPSPYLVDWDGDGKKDLLFGTDEGKIYFYSNEGTNHKPRFVSGAPLMAGGKVIKEGSRVRIDVTDWNNDGKLDLLFGNFCSVKDASAPRGRRMGGNVWLFLGK